MFRNFKHKPVQVSAVEVTAEYIQSLDPEQGPIYPHFDSRTGAPVGVDWRNQTFSAGIGSFVIRDDEDRFHVVAGPEFMAKYDPAW